MQAFQRVFLRKGDKLSLVPTLGHIDADFGSGPSVAQPAFQNARLLQHLVGQDQFARDMAAGRIELADELFQHGRVRFTFGVVDRARIAADQFAIADKHDLHCGVAFVASQRNHIVIGHVLAAGFVFIGDIVDGCELITDTGGFFKIELFGRGHHLIHQAPLYALCPAAEHIHQFLYHSSIFVATDGPDARRVAQLDVMEQASAFVAAVDVTIAGQIRKGFAQVAQCFLHDPHRGIRPEVTRPVAHDSSCGFDFWKSVSPANADVGIALVVFELNVESRFVLLDQRFFQDQRLDFALGDEEIDVADCIAHAQGLAVAIGLRREITADAVAQSLCLADIDDLAADGS